MHRPQRAFQSSNSYTSLQQLSTDQHQQQRINTTESQQQHTFRTSLWYQDRQLVIALVNVASLSCQEKMDTSYLTSQVATVVNSLHALFDDIGVPSHDREAREAAVSNCLVSQLSKIVH